jgi:hypothetical protein
MKNNDNCKMAQDVMAYLQNELKPEESARFKTHLSSCSACAKILEDNKLLLQQLKDVPKEQPQSAIADKVLERIETQPSLRPRHFIWVSAAAGILIAVVGLIIIFHKSSNSTPALGKALDWLTQNQEPTGKWSAEKWGGNRQYEVALSGLSIMALMGSGEKEWPKYNPNIQKGIEYLIDQQSADGRFGPFFNGSLYNHGIATVCMLEMTALNKESKWNNSINAALDYIKKSQTPSGGWGYLTLPNEAPNTAASFWVLQSLIWAKSMGFDNVTPYLEKGFQWLASISDDTGRPGYKLKGDFPYGSETLSAMAAFFYTYGGAKYLPESEKYQSLIKNIAKQVFPPNEINYYHLYFIAYLEYPETNKCYKEMANTLINSQSKDNLLAGSWESNDQWGQVGGRVYSTAFASLTLEANNRRMWLKSNLK